LEFKIKLRFQTIDKSIQIQPSKEIQIFDPHLLGTYFSLKLGVTRSLLAKFYQIPSFQEFSIIFP
jgi:hypothetical protein